MSDLKEWLKQEKHLPEFMRDFHDQKDLFKTIHGTMKPTDDPCYKINWTQAQIYVCDTFLAFMAQCGYTLQRSRAKHDFCNVTQVVDKHMTELRQSFTDALKSRLHQLPTEHLTKEG